MKILRVKKTLFYDIFLGNGWYNHTRILFKKDHVHYQSGKSLTKIQNIEVAKTILAEKEKG